MQRNLALQNPAAHLLVAHGRGLVAVKDQLVAVLALRLIPAVVRDHLAVDVVEKVVLVRRLHDAPVGRLIGGARGISIRVRAQEEDDGVQFVQREALAVDERRVILHLRGDVEVVLVPHRVYLHGAVGLAVPVFDLIDDLRFAVDTQAAGRIPLGQVSIDDHILGTRRFEVSVHIGRRGHSETEGQRQHQHHQGNGLLHRGILLQLAGGCSLPHFSYLL